MLIAEKDKAISVILSGYDYELMIASSCVSLLSMLPRYRPSILITDMDLIEADKRMFLLKIKRNLSQH